MVRRILIIGMAGVGLLLTGCQTMTMDSEQHIRHYSRVADLNRRMLAEDVDALLLLDQPSSLTHYKFQRTK